MSKEPKKLLIPKLRFPEFRKNGGWNKVQLSQISERILEKVGEQKLTTVSITAGKGFVSQAEKFSRDISGKQYQNYIVLKEGQFSYNKGNSKKFPQGCIYKLTEFEKIAVPNAFISFRLLDGYDADFYQAYFDVNFHGKQLQKFITSGARADGLLNISPDDFFSIKLPSPKFDEQRKIARCISSLNDLIAAQNDKVAGLKNFKKGLLQQLFPQEGEIFPRLRFPEFQSDEPWVEKTLGELATITSGGTPSRTKVEYWNGSIPWVTTTLINFNTIYSTNETISELGLTNSSAKIFRRGTILMAMYGQGVTRGKVGMLGIDAATNQACAAILLKESLFPMFLFQNLAGRYDEIRKISNSGGQENLSAELIKSIRITFPKSEVEQKKIATTLSSCDALISAHEELLDLFKLHKNGLLQQLFPSLTESADE